MTTQAPSQPPDSSEAARSDYLSSRYQKADLDYIVEAIKAGESCSLVGIGSCGKSNLVSLLTEDHIKRSHFGNAYHSFIVVLLDPHLLINLNGQALDSVGPCWSGYEIMLHGLWHEIFNLKENGAFNESITKELEDIAKAIEKSYALVTTSQSAVTLQLGLRYLVDSIDDVLVLGKSWRIIYVFDEVEEFLNALPSEFFQSLRGIRDRFRFDRNLVYVTTGRRTLPELAIEQIARHGGDEHVGTILEGFYELSRDFTYFIPPLSKESVKENVKRYNRRFQSNLDEAGITHVVNLLHDVTGGHAGLVRRSYHGVVMMRKIQNSEGLHRYLLEQSAVVEECQSILKSLNKDEIAILVNIAKNEPVRSSSVVDNLTRKHLLKFSGRTKVITFPLLADYLADTPIGQVTG